MQLTLAEENAVDRIQKQKVCRIVRWTARIIGTLLLVLFLVGFVASFVAEGATPLGQLTTAEILMFGATFMMLVGVALAWRWEFVGGALAIAGGIGFTVVDSVRSGFRIVWFPAVFVVVGVLYVLHAWRCPQAVPAPDPPEAS